MFGGKQKRVRAKTLANARELKQKGELDQAVALLRADPDLREDAAQWLAEAGRNREAARLLLDGVDTTPAGVGRLDAAGRKRVLKAAIYFQKAGEAKQAIDLYKALGEEVRVQQLLEQADLQGPVATRPATGGVAAVDRGRDFEEAGDFEHALEAYIRDKNYMKAGKLLRQMGKLKEAAETYLNGELFFEAAACWLDADEPGLCMDALVLVPSTDPRYRHACLQAIRTAIEFDVMSFRFDNFIGAFLESGPQDELEIDVFFDLGSLYVNHDMLEQAREAFQHVEDKNPNYDRVADMLDAVNQGQQGSAVQLARILQDERKFRRSGAPPLAAGETTAKAKSSPVHSRSGSHFTPGTIVDERYRLDRVIGKGGNAVVMQAHDLELKLDVALKVITALAPDDDTIERFKRELRVSRQLTHQNIIRVHDIGVDEGRRYISMELLQGDTLEDRLGAPLLVDLGVDYLVQACAGLEEAHRQEVVHRDVKPGNLFLTRDNIVKVMDFGLARQYGAGAVSLTGSSITGTPKYMAPEQINQRPVTPATDIYSLGVVAYEMFTGDVPFYNDELLRLLMMHVSDTPVPPRRKNSAVPPALEKIILKALAKHPSERFQSCRELADALSAV